MIETADAIYHNWEMAFKRVKSADRPPPPLAEALHGNFIARRRRGDLGSSPSSLGSGSVPLQINSDDSLVNGVRYRGTRSRRKVDFSITMFAGDVDKWYEEDDESARADEGTPLMTFSQQRRTTTSTPSTSHRVSADDA